MLEEDKEKINIRTEAQTLPQAAPPEIPPDEVDLSQAYIEAAQEAFNVVCKVRKATEEADAAAEAGINAGKFRLHQLGQICLTIGEERAFKEVQGRRRIQEALRLRQHAALNPEGDI